MSKNTLSRFFHYIILLPVAVSFIAATVFYHRANKWKEEAKRNAKNVETLSEEIKAYSVRDSLQAVSIGQLEFSLKEYKKYRAEDLSLIEDMKLDLKQLREVTKVNTTTEVIKTIPVEKKDTLIEASYSDLWHDIKISVESDSISYELHISDSVLIAVHVIPRKFLWFKWGCKDVKVDAVSKNPYTKSLSIEDIIFH